MSDPSLAPVSEGDVLAKKYRVEKILGVGGMGVVVAATHLQLDQRVALKFLLPTMLYQGHIVQRFERASVQAVCSQQNVDDLRALFAQRSGGGAMFTAMSVTICDDFVRTVIVACGGGVDAAVN